MIESVLRWPTVGQPYLLFCILIVSTFPCLYAQNNSQILRGSVTDAVSNKPLVGATILLDNEFGTTTDTLGNFIFKEIVRGRHQVMVTYIGYDTLQLNDLIIRSGQESNLNLSLDPISNALSLVTITGESGGVYTIVPAQEIISRESVLRYPATYFDPARLATAYAGVTGTNDQSNGMSVRGHSPNALGWRLQGVEIVNPNHTPNAGTPSDRSTASSGGVNMISAQLFSDTRFFRGLIPGRYGNTSSGLIDMYLREGNDQNWDYTAQVGLIGLDIAAEGPLGRKGASILTNYRYSTVGLLGDLGLDLGDEQISFQDIALHLSTPLKNNGSLSIFALGGISKNIFTSDSDPSLWEEDKDQFDIDFEHQIGIIGTKLTIPLSKNGSWHTSMALSGLDGSRFARPNAGALSNRSENDDYWQAKTSIQSYVQIALPNRQSLSLGTGLLYQQDFLAASINQQQLAYGRMSRWTIQPYATWRSRLSNSWQTEVSLRGYLLSDSDAQIEPRATLSWQVRPESQIQIAYGWQHQRQPVQVEIASNQRLEGYRTQQSSISWTKKFDATKRFTLTTYFQQMDKLAISAEGPNTFNAINLLETFELGPLATEGKAQNFGSEITLEKIPQDTWYYLLTASIYDARYQGSDGIWRDSRWDAQFVANAIVGREWLLAPKKKNDRLLGVSLRLSSSGGLRISPIDERASELAGTTIFDTENAFSEQLASYSRIDLRIFFRKDHPSKTTTLSLDVQNLANTKNEAFRYYDPLLKEVTIKNQLGTIPLLSYRMQF